MNMQETFCVQRSEHISLRGYVHKPENPDLKNAVLIVHGYPEGYAGGPRGSKYYPIPYTLAKALEPDHLVCRFSLSGSKGSQGRFEDKSLWEHVMDIGAVVDGLKDEYGAVVSKIVAHSMGGIFALAYLSTNHNHVDTMVSIACPCDAQEAINQDFDYRLRKKLIQDDHQIYQSLKSRDWFHDKFISPEYVKTVQEFNVGDAIMRWNGEIYPLIARNDERYSHLCWMFLEDFNKTYYRMKKEKVIEADHLFTQEAALIELSNHIKKILSPEKQG